MRICMFLAILGAAVAYTVRTPLTTENAKTYWKKLGQDHVVEQGGYYALEQEATKQLAEDSFAALKPNLPDDFDVVACGGWNNLQQYAADPKGTLVELIKSGLKSTKGLKTGSVEISNESLTALLALLSAYGKGYDSETVDGEWATVMVRQGSMSPKFQKIVGAGEKAFQTFSNFDVKSSTFNGNVKLIFGQGDLRSTVKFNPVAAGFSKVGNTIVIRRIMCDIVGASWKFWKLPRVPLPLRAKGGSLDFVYLDDDIRVTTGNRGGVFVHVRPAFLETMLA